MRVRWRCEERCEEPRGISARGVMDEKQTNDDSQLRGLSEEEKNGPITLRARTMAGSDNPFANADAWRKHPLLTGTWRAAAPGFFLGLAAFGCYYAFDKATAKKQAKH